MPGTNVTYILGAGSSCYSQTLVFDMKERMKCLLELLDTTHKNHIYICDSLKGKTEKLHIRYRRIVEEAIKHYTPDTYAKKLSLTERIKDLDILKEYLNLYFLFEQDMDRKFYNEKGSYPRYQTPGFPASKSKEVREQEKENEKNYIWNKIKTPIDYRYDVFLATLLNNKGTKDNPLLLLPSNYNIISWNYDNQWEFAYKEYAKDEKLNEISRRLNINREYDPDKSHIIKVNGYCNCWDEEKDQELTLYNAIDRLLNSKNIKNTIEFAWEGTRLQYIPIKKIMKKTDIIVIIGYSFPNFNRDVDKTIFWEYTVSETKEIIIQVPDKYEYEKIKQRIRTIKTIPDEVFKHIPDKDQFYIPL